MNKIEIYDTTLGTGRRLRDISFSVNDKIKIVKLLDELGVDYIEAGGLALTLKTLKFLNN